MKVIFLFLLSFSSNRGGGGSISPVIYVYAVSDDRESTPASYCTGELSLFLGDNTYEYSCKTNISVSSNPVVYNVIPLFSNEDIRVKDNVRVKKRTALLI